MGDIQQPKQKTDSFESVFCFFGCYNRRMNKQQGSLIVIILIVVAGIVMIGILVGMFRQGQFNRLTPENLFNPNFSAHQSTDITPPNGYLFELGIEPTSPNAVVSDEPAPEPAEDCEFTVTEPDTERMIETPFFIRGSVASCDQWPVVDGEVGTVEVFVDGMQVSQTYALSVSSQTAERYFFEAFIDESFASYSFATLIFKNTDFDNANAYALGVSVEF